MLLLPCGILPFVTIAWTNLLWGLSRLENIFEIITFLFLLHLQRKVCLQVKFPNFRNSKSLPKFFDFQRLRAWLNPHSRGRLLSTYFPSDSSESEFTGKWVVIPAWTREERKQEVSFLKDRAFAIPGVCPASDSWSRLGAELVALTERHDFNRRPIVSQRVHSYIAADPGGLISGALLRERVFLSSLEVVLCFEGMQ